MTCLVDTCGWIEWLTEGPLADCFAPYLQDLSKVVVPTAVQYELYRWICREADEQRALEVIGLTLKGQVADLSTALALLAGDLSRQYRLSFADAIIYASARQERCLLITCDDHFEGLPEVEYFSKKSS